MGPPSGRPGWVVCGIVEILWWLAPAAVVTVTAMAWVAWRARADGEQVDREAALSRMERALTRGRPVRGRRVPARVDRSSGVAVRPSRSEGVCHR